MPVQKIFDKLTLQTYYINQFSEIIDKYEQTRQCYLPKLNIIKFTKLLFKLYLLARPSRS